MKKVFIGLAIFIVLLVAAAALVPLLFKDNIKQADLVYVCFRK